MEIDFCIASNGQRRKTIELAVQSIKVTCLGSRISHRSIICGQVDRSIQYDAEIINERDTVLRATLGALRNRAAHAGSAEIIVFVDDDIIFPENWAKQLRKFADQQDWSLLANRILLPDRGRYWDRATIRPHRLVEYEHPIVEPQLYQCGGFMVMKRSVFERLQWDETIPIYAERFGGTNEDVEYSQRLIANGFRIAFDKENLVWHWDENYEQRGPHILRRRRDPYSRIPPIEQPADCKWADLGQSNITCSNVFQP